MNTKRLATVLCGTRWLSANGAADAQVVGRGSTVEGDILRGQGVLLSGAGWYNLRTAQANAINTETVIRWKQDLRKIQQERLVQEAQKKYDKNKNVEELKQQIRQREQELRTDPKPEDVQSGAALNALVYDLTDPDITSNQWRSRSIDLPPGTSVKELIFSFTPNRISSRASAALSRGVIALSRLDIKDKWPAVLKKDELSQERKAYEDAYLRVQNKVLRGEYSVDEIIALDTALDRLKAKIMLEIPKERGFQGDAISFVNDLKNATSMFDANSIDYAKEILLDTKDHDATTVQELVEFMSKYRLQFATSDRSPVARVLYGQIHEKLREQLTVLRSTPIPAPSVKSKGAELSGAKTTDDKWISLFNGKDFSGWTGMEDEARWRITDGTIIGEGLSPRKPASWIFSREEFGDFVLRLEFNWDANTTSSICFRAIKNERNLDPPGPIMGYPAFTLANAKANQPLGTTFFLNGTKGRKPDFTTEAISPGTWHRAEFELTGRRMRAAVNGKPVVDVVAEADEKTADGRIPGLNRVKGHIGLQTYFGTVKFRNITIRELVETK